MSNERKGRWPQTRAERLLDKRSINEVTGCWEWTGGRTRGPKGGYGRFWDDGKNTTSHRAAYLEWVGEIPDGLEVDHICNNRACFNPEHMRLLSHADNVMRSPYSMSGMNSRKTHCKNGHEFTPDNTVQRLCPDGNTRRWCRACRKEYYEANKDRQAAQKAERRRLKRESAHD